MTDDEILGMTIFILLVIGFFCLVVGSALKDEYKQRKQNKLQEIKSTKGREIKEITKAEAIKLIKDFPKNASHNLELLKRGEHYFIYGTSYNNWVDTSANIPNYSLLIAKKFDVTQEIKKKQLNMSSRLLIFNEYGKSKKKELPYYVLRHVWAIGSLEKEKELLTSLYEREDFKQFYEKHEYQMREIWELSDKFLKQAEMQKALSDTSLAYITTMKDYCIGKSNNVTFKLYEAVDGFQVVAEIPNII